MLVDTNRRNRSHIVVSAALALLITCGPSARADVFNMPAGQTSLDFVTVGDPGNVGDTAVMADDRSTGYGAVGYVYRMGKYDVTAAQYAQFLNAVAATDTYGLYTTDMENIPAAFIPGAGIVRNGSPGSYTYSVQPGHENYPIATVYWGVTT